MEKLTLSTLLTPYEFMSSDTLSGSAAASELTASPFALATRSRLFLAVLVCTLHAAFCTVCFDNRNVDVKLISFTCSECSWVSKQHKLHILTFWCSSDVFVYGKLKKIDQNFKKL